MRNIRQPDMKKLRTPESTSKDYAISKQRLLDLSKVIDTADQAKSIEVFVDSFLDDAEDTLLKEIIKPDSDVEMLRHDYIAALRLKKKIDDIIQIGKQKEHAFEKVKTLLQGGK